MAGEQAVDTARDKIFPLTLGGAGRSKPATLVQWGMDFETQVRGGGAPASPQALLAGVGSLFLNHFVHCTPAEGTSKGSL